MVRGFKLYLKGGNMPGADKSLRTYADQYLICRDLGHAWMEDQRLEKRASEVGSYARVLGCGRCNMTRIETLNHRGELMFRSYRQPKGYRITRISVQDIRSERIKRENRARRNARTV